MMQQLQRDAERVKLESDYKTALAMERLLNEDSSEESSNDEILSHSEEDGHTIQQTLLHWCLAEQSESVQKHEAEPTLHPPY